MELKTTEFGFKVFHFQKQKTDLDGDPCIKKRKLCTATEWFQKKGNLFYISKGPSFVVLGLENIIAQVSVLCNRFVDMRQAKLIEKIPDSTPPNVSWKII